MARLGRPPHDKERALLLMEELRASGEVSGDSAAAREAVARLTLPGSWEETLRLEYGKRRRSKKLYRDHPISRQESDEIRAAYARRGDTRTNARERIAFNEDLARSLGIDLNSIEIDEEITRLQALKDKLDEFAPGGHPEVRLLMVMNLRQPSPEAAEEKLAELRRLHIVVERQLAALREIVKWRRVMVDTEFSPASGEN